MGVDAGAVTRGYLAETVAVTEGEGVTAPLAPFRMVEGRRYALRYRSSRTGSGVGEHSYHEHVLLCSWPTGDVPQVHQLKAVVEAKDQLSAGYFTMGVDVSTGEVCVVGNGADGFTIGWTTRLVAVDFDQLA
jgi:hypothetical protein